ASRPRTTGCWHRSAGILQGQNPDCRILFRTSAAPRQGPRRVHDGITQITDENEGRKLLLPVNGFTSPTCPLRTGYLPALRHRRAFFCVHNTPFSALATCVRVSAHGCPLTCPSLPHPLLPPACY